MNNVFVENIDNTQNISIENTSIQYIIEIESTVEGNQTITQLPVSSPSSIVVQHVPGNQFEIVIENYIRSVEELGLPVPSLDGQILAGYIDGTLAWINQYSHPAYSPISLDAVTGQVIDTLITNSSGHVTGATLRYLQVTDIPNLPISKITGLQTALDDRYTETELQGDGTAEVHWNNLTNVPDYIVNGSAQYQIPITGVTPFTPSWTTALNLVGAEGLNSLTYVSASFVKMTEANKFELDTNTYSLSNHAHAHSEITDSNTGDDHTQYALLAGRSGDVLKVDELQEYIATNGVKIDGLILKDTGINFEVGATTRIFKDGSNNLSFMDAVTGTKTLAQLVNAPMVYPGAGIALSTGSAWDTSITDNSVNWNTAYGWGNHASAGYLTSLGTALIDADFTSIGLMKRGTNSGEYSIVTDNSSNWNTAYGWGNHASAGYLTALPNHDLVNTTHHPVSGLTTGHFLKATGATTYAFAAHGLTYTDVGAQQSDATLTALAGLTITQGSLIYGTGADAFSILAKGTAGQVLRMNSGATAPEWGAASSDTGVIKVAKAEVLYTNQTQTTIVTLPADAIVWDIGIDVVTVFDDTGTNYLDIGVTSDGGKWINNLSIESSTFFILANIDRPASLYGSFPIKMTGSTNITFTYDGQNNDATQGQAFVYVHYSLH